MNDYETSPVDGIEAAEAAQEVAGSPLVFISHDGRDAEFAEAFSQLLRSVSFGMLKSFRSSDKKGTEGIEYGDEWYKRLMSKLGSASDVVCLFTGRSLDRPWILYEAGVAKGKLGTPVYGVALGIPLKLVSVGPFYQFQNCGDSGDELTKLVLQLARRVKGADPDEGVVRSQVDIFRTRVNELVSELPEEEGVESAADDSSVAKLFEEVKVMFRDLPLQIDSRLAEESGAPRRRPRRLHPRMIEELVFMPYDDEGDPVGLLVLAGLIRDDIPWLYDVTLEVYRAARAGSIRDLQRLMRTVEHLDHFAMRGPWMDEFRTSHEVEMMMHELPPMLHTVLQRTLEKKQARRP